MESYFYHYCTFSGLDIYLDIGESDLIYTESLMKRGVEHYEVKDVLILGDGDGALLYELLKENPKKVTMIEVRIKYLLKFIFLLMDMELSWNFSNYLSKSEISNILPLIAFTIQITCLSTHLL